MKADDIQTDEIETVWFAVSSEERALLEAEAERAGVTVEDLCRQRLLEPDLEALVDRVAEALGFWAGQIRCGLDRFRQRGTASEEGLPNVVAKTAEALDAARAALMAALEGQRS